jgi:hypothetical protein
LYLLLKYVTDLKVPECKAQSVFHEASEDEKIWFVVYSVLSPCCEHPSDATIASLGYHVAIIPAVVCSSETQNISAANYY